MIFPINENTVQGVVVYFTDDLQLDKSMENEISRVLLEATSGKPILGHDIGWYAEPLIGFDLIVSVLIGLDLIGLVLIG